MRWYAQTEEAKTHMRECKGCENCLWIEESAHAMYEYGVVKEPKKHALFNLIKKRFDGVEIS